MAIPVRVEGVGPEGATREAAVSKDGELFTLTSPVVKFASQVLPFLDTAGNVGNAMNQNVAFSGTPDAIHDGEDRSLYTASQIVGSSATFDSTTHCFQGIATIVDFNLIDVGETVTITVDAVQTVLTEPGDWDAVTSNTQTATNLAAAIDALNGVSATSALAVVTVIADVGSDITELITSGTSGELIVTGQSTLISNPPQGDIVQFDRESDIVMSNFAAITLRIFVEKDWDADDSVGFCAWDVSEDAVVGNLIQLEDHFNFPQFDTWHSIVLTLDELGITTATNVDAFRIEMTNRNGAKSPIYHVDRLQVEAVGAPISFRINASRGPFHISSVIISLEDVFDSRLANSSMPNLPTNQLLGVSRLATGITFTRVEDGDVAFSFGIKDLSDAFGSGVILSNALGTTTDTSITLEIGFSNESLVVLRGEPSLNYMEFKVNDDLSGLTKLTAIARGGRAIS